MIKKNACNYFFLRHIALFHQPNPLPVPKFEEYSKSAFYLMFGMERVLLACIAGAVAYVIVQCGVIDVGKITLVNNDWGLVLVSIMAGFSESLVPSVIEKVSEKVAEKKSS